MSEHCAAFESRACLKAALLSRPTHHSARWLESSYRRRTTGHRHVFLAPLNGSHRRDRGLGLRPHQHVSVFLSNQNQMRSWIVLSWLVDPHPRTVTKSQAIAMCRVQRAKLWPLDPAVTINVEAALAVNSNMAHSPTDLWPVVQMEPNLPSHL